MEYRYLGRTGIRVSCVSLGAFNFGDGTTEDVARDIMSTAIAKGVNLIDTADSYSAGESERIVGRYLSETKKRDEVILATKVFYATGSGPNDLGLSRYHIVRACDDSLRRLQTDRIDLYMMHRSGTAEVPVDETLRALDDLIRAGKVLYIGCSTHTAWAVVEAVLVSEIKGFARLVAESPPYNVLDRRIENELVPACQKYGLGILPWSPLAMGMLAGRYPEDGSLPEGSRAAANPEGIYARRIDRHGLDVAAKFVSLAPTYDLLPGQLALLWVKDQPGVTSPIVGPRTLEQLTEMLVVADLHADDNLRGSVDGLNPPGRAVANFHNTSGWMKS